MPVFDLLSRLKRRHRAGQAPVLQTGTPPLSSPHQKGHPTVAKVLVLYYSSYGHLEQMAGAVADGAREAGADVVVKRVPEIAPEETARASHYKLDQAAPIATVDELAGYDAIIFGTPTRFGVISGQMKAFLDQTGGLWHSGALLGKVGSFFTASATQHGGQEATILGSLPFLFHHGMVIVGLPYAAQGQMRLDEISGGSPYGVATIAGTDGARQPSANELELARFQGKHVTEVAIRQRISLEAAKSLG
jgi:NAD(P)H dehydrogenase (quinone)